MARLLRVADFYANGMLLMSSPQSRIRPISCAEANEVTGLDHPPALDRVAVRGEILALTATLSRFSEKQQAEVMSAPFPRMPVRVWLVRDPKLSSLDPIEAAFDLLAEVTVSDVLPTQSQATEHDGIVVIARSTLTGSPADVEITRVATREDGHKKPVLWLVGRADGASNSLRPVLWPITLANLANFVSSASNSGRHKAAA